MKKVFAKLAKKESESFLVGKVDKRGRQMKLNSRRKLKNFSILQDEKQIKSAFELYS